MRAAVLAAAIFAAGIVFGGEGENTPTNYFVGYIYTGSFTNAGTTGLSTSQEYVCIPRGILSANLTDAQANATTGDIRAIIYSIVQRFYEAREASTNQTATTISRGTAYNASTTNVNETVTHIIKTVRRLGSATLP